MKPPAAAKPVVALIIIKKVMAAIWEKLDRLDSPEYACQLVLVVKDTAVLKARSGVCAARCKLSPGIQACTRKRTYPRSNMAALLNKSARPYRFQDIFSSGFTPSSRYVPRSIRL